MVRTNGEANQLTVEVSTSTARLRCEAGSGHHVSGGVAHLIAESPNEVTDRLNRVWLGAFRP